MGMSFSRGPEYYQQQGMMQNQTGIPYPQGMGNQKMQYQNNQQMFQNNQFGSSQINNPQMENSRMNTTKNIVQSDRQNVSPMFFLDTEYQLWDLFSRLIRLISTMQVESQTDEEINLVGNCQITCQIKLKQKDQTNNILVTNQDEKQNVVIPNNIIQEQYSIEHIIKYLETIQQNPKQNKIILFKNKYTLNKTIEVKMQFNSPNCPFWELVFVTPEELHSIYKYIKMLKDIELIGGVLYNQVSLETLELLAQNIK